MLFQAVASMRSTFITFARLQYYHGRDSASKDRDPTTPAVGTGKCELRTADDLSRDYARYNRGGRTRDVGIGTVVFGFERRVLFLYDPSGQCPLPTNLTLTYRDLLQESPKDKGNLWQTIRWDFGTGRAAVGQLGIENPARERYPVVRTATTNALSGFLHYLPDLLSADGDDNSAGTDPPFSYRDFSRLVVALGRQGAEAFPLADPSPNTPPVYRFGPANADEHAHSTHITGVVASGAQNTRGPMLALGPPSEPPPARPQPHFHTALLRGDLGQTTASLLLRLGLHLRDHPHTYPLAPRHMLYSRLSILRNEVPCAPDDDSMPPELDGFTEWARDRRTPAEEDDLLPVAWRADLAKLKGLFNSPPPHPPHPTPHPTALAADPQGGCFGEHDARPAIVCERGGGHWVGWVGVRGSARLLIVNPDVPSAADPGAANGGPALAIRRLAELARWPLGGVAMTVDVVLGADDGGAAMSVRVVTPAGPRRVLAFLAARAAPGAPWAGSPACVPPRVARRAGSRVPLMLFALGTVAGAPRLDQVRMVRFPPPPARGGPPLVGGRFVGSRDGDLFVGECQPTAVGTAGFSCARDEMRAGGQLTSVYDEPLACLADDEQSENMLWMLLLEADDDEEAHVVIAEGHRVATAGHGLLVSRHGSAMTFPEHGAMVRGLAGLQPMQGYGSTTYQVHGVVRDDYGVPIELF